MGHRWAGRAFVAGVTLCSCVGSHDAVRNESTFRAAGAEPAPPASVSPAGDDSLSPRKDEPRARAEAGPPPPAAEPAAPPADPAADVARMLSSIDGETGRRAERDFERVVDLGAAAVAPLVAVLDRAPDVQPEAAADAIARIGAPAEAARPALSRLVLDRETRPTLRAAALVAICRLEPKWEGSLGTLVENYFATSVGDGDVIAAALVRLGPEPANAIVRLLGASSGERRVRMTRALWFLGREGWARPPRGVAWVELVSGLALGCVADDRDVRWFSALGLACVPAGERVRALPALIALFGDPDRDVRRVAIEALTSGGTWARPAESVLVLALDDRWFLCRHYALLALSRIGASSPDGVERLARIARDAKSPLDRARALRAVGRGAELSPRARQILVDALADESGDVRAAAVTCLFARGTPADELWPCLVERLDQAPATCGSPAQSAFARMGRAASGAVADAVTAVPPVIDVSEHVVSWAELPPEPAWFDACDESESVGEPAATRLRAERAAGPR